MPRGTNWIASTSFVRWLPGLLAVIVGLSLTIFGPAAAFGASPTSPATAEVLASYSYDTASNGLESTVAAAFGEARARIPAVTSSVVSTGEVSAFPVDTVAADTADEVPGLSSDYKDITTGKSIRNVQTDVTPEQFGNNLTAEGWKETTSTSGRGATIYMNDGAKYVVYPESDSTGGPTAEFTPRGASGSTLKIRLGP